MELRRHPVAVFVSLAVILLIGLGCWWGVTAYLHATSSQSTDNQSVPKQKINLNYVCDDRLIKRASPLIENADLGGLQTISTTVEGISGYTNDPNCEYILLRAYLLLGNVTKATSAQSTLKLLISAGGKYSAAFTPTAQYPDVFDQSIKLLTEQQSNISDGGYGDLVNKQEGN